MALIVVFDELASPQKVLGVNRSADTGQYLGRTDIVVNPDLTALDGIVPQRYWKHDTGLIVEFSQAEKDAQDAAEAQAADDALRLAAPALLDGQVPLALLLRAFADIIKDEFNILRALHSLPDRTLAQLKAAIQSRTAPGNVDE